MNEFEWRHLENSADCKTVDHNYHVLERTIESLESQLKAADQLVIEVKGYFMGDAGTIDIDKALAAYEKQRGKQ